MIELTGKYTKAKIFTNKLWNFFSKHATQVSVLNAIQKTMKDLDIQYRGINDNKTTSIRIYI